jgi:hypothetical protein
VFLPCNPKKWIGFFSFNSAFSNKNAYGILKWVSHYKINFFPLPTLTVPNLYQSFVSPQPRKSGFSSLLWNTYAGVICSANKSFRCDSRQTDRETDRQRYQTFWSVSVEASKERDKISRRYYLHGLKTLAKLFDISIQTYVFQKLFKLYSFSCFLQFFRKKKNLPLCFKLIFNKGVSYTYCNVMKTNMQMLEPNWFALNTKCPHFTVCSKILIYSIIFSFKCEAKKMQKRSSFHF